MITRTIKEVHHELLSLLKEVDKICDYHKINYSLFAGTLIGAIRHQGFIPWDDDADVIFERKEFDKFIQVIPADFEIIRDPWVPRFKKKGEDIYLDIFVFDSTSKNVYLQNIQILELKFIQGTIKDKLTLTKGGIIEKILSLSTYVFGRLFSKKFKIKIYDRVAKRYNRTDNECVFSSLDQFKYIGHVLPKRIISSYNKITFEDTQLMIMDGYHDYLTKFYGDYMKLPDEHTRIPEHGNVKK